MNANPSALPDTDLFGDPVTFVPKERKVLLPGGRWKGGYPAAPGSGPKNETCGTCKHYTRSGNGNKTFGKCLLIRHAWTCGPGTDIKKRMVACALWKHRDSMSSR